MRSNNTNENWTISVVEPETKDISQTEGDKIKWNIWGGREGLFWASGSTT